MTASVKSKPSVRFEFEVEKIIGLSSDGNYQVQWAPAWVSKVHLVGCEHLIQEFLQQQTHELKPDPETLCISAGDRTSEFVDSRYGEDLTSGESHDQNQASTNSMEYPDNVPVSDESVISISTAGTENQDNLPPLTATDSKISSAYPDDTVPFSEEHESSVADSKAWAVCQNERSVINEINDAQLNIQEYPSSQLLLRQTHNVTEMNEERTSLEMETCLSDKQLLLSKDHDVTSLSNATASNKKIIVSNSHLSIDEGVEPHNEPRDTTDTQQVDNGLFGITNTSSRRTCFICYERFSSTSELKHHIRIHFVCQTCGKSFISNGGLMRHTRMHTGDRPFTCNVCGNSFTRKGHMEKHQRIHTGEKPFTCEVCGRQFSQSGSLKTHFRLHTGVRPYRCKFCGKTFTSLSGHNDHLTRCLSASKDS